MEEHILKTLFPETTKRYREILYLWINALIPILREKGIDPSPFVLEQLLSQNIETRSQLIIILSVYSMMNKEDQVEFYPVLKTELCNLQIHQKSYIFSIYNHVQTFCRVLLNYIKTHNIFW